MIKFNKQTADIKGIKELSDNIEKLKGLPEEITKCDSPIVVQFEGFFYVFYTICEEWKSRVAVARTSDFKNYEKLGTIKHCFSSDKYAFIFPERVNDKVVYIHRIEPNIQIEYFDSIEDLISQKSWKGYENRFEHNRVLRRKYQWEEKELGGSVPPIKTEAGWLFLYHGVDNNTTYSLGAVLLDLNNPSKVIARIPYSLLQSEAYDALNDKSNEHLPKTFYISGDELFLYYSTEGECAKLVKININELVDELKSYAN